MKKEELFPDNHSAISQTRQDIANLERKEYLNIILTSLPASAISCCFKNQPSFLQSEPAPTKDTTATASRMAKPSIHACPKSSADAVDNSITSWNMAQPIKILSIKSSSAPLSISQKVVRSGGSFLCVPKCMVLSYKELLDIPDSVEVLRHSSIWTMPPSDLLIYSSSSTYFLSL